MHEEFNMVDTQLNISKLRTVKWVSFIVFVIVVKVLIVK